MPRPDLSRSGVPCSDVPRSELPRPEAHAARSFSGRLRLLACQALVAAVVAIALSGCGKAGYPEPQDPSRAFTWKEITAEPAGKCVAFKGAFEGSYENFEAIRLEIESLDGPEDCPGCPFVPDEVTEISRRDAGFDRRKGTISFSYCPRVAKAYRWRLAAISRYSRLPHASMPDRLLIMPSP